tara:strand:+ start:9911 stop:11509 length:1599 start_codon:yes stop_codon:yes gene_type:complete
MKNIELFAGCGGLSLGLETAGFETVMANELSPMAGETYAYNLLNADLGCGNNDDNVLWVSSSHSREKLNSRLRENPFTASGLSHEHFSDLTSCQLTSSDLTGSLLIGSIVDLNKLLSDPTSKLQDLFSEAIGSNGLDLVSGGPPCQSFSLAGLRDHSNHRNQLPWEFIKFVKMSNPKLALLENVSGILRAFNIEGKPYYAWFELAKAFAGIGYVPICLHINAKYVGAAQNRPRFILIAIRADVYSQIVTNCSDKLLLDAISHSKAFFDSINRGLEPEFGSLPCFDLAKGHEVFISTVFSPLASTSESNLVTVKDAIDDLRDSEVAESKYVGKINSIFDNRHGHENQKIYNHDNRVNTARVKARFRLYQIMTKLPKAQSKEISKFLKTNGESGMLSSTLKMLRTYWLLDITGQKLTDQSDTELLQLLSSLYTKKQTQRALIPNAPAPAALSIPDDACHYFESVDTLRTLTVREMARIQSFPDWYKIKSKVTTGGQMRKFEVPQYTQIGNAVPPLLALALGKVCKNLINVSKGI